MSARDEFADAIYAADRAHKNDPIDLTTHYSYVITDELIAAGYRRPRVVTTVAELDALSAPTVVKDALGQVFEKQESGPWHDGPHDWLSFEGTFWDVDAIHFPATVLHEPEAS